MDYIIYGHPGVHGGVYTHMRSTIEDQKVHSKKMNTTTWQIKDAQISARGAKTCTLTKAKDERVFMSLGSRENAVRTPFGATTFNDESATRKTIEFTLSPEQHKQFQDFDEWAIEYLSKNSERLLKKPMNQEQIKQLYKSPVTQKGDFPPHLRCKINVSGNAICRAWDIDGNRTELPQDLRHCDLVPRIHISHLWIMSKEIGFVCNVIDIMCKTHPELCPF